MGNDGKLNFGVYTGAFKPEHHHVRGLQRRAVAPCRRPRRARRAWRSTSTGVRQGRATGRRGTQAYTGYWRLGGDNLGSWPNQPASNFFAGTVDEAAEFYPAALTPTQVVAHYNASGRTGAPGTATPTDTYGRAVVADGASGFLPPR